MNKIDDNFKSILYEFCSIEITKEAQKSNFSLPTLFSKTKGEPTSQEKGQEIANWIDTSLTQYEWRQLPSGERIQKAEELIAVIGNLNNDVFGKFKAMEEKKNSLKDMSFVFRIFYRSPSSTLIKKYEDTHNALLLAEKTLSTIIEATKQAKIDSTSVATHAAYLGFPIEIVESLGITDDILIELQEISSLGITPQTLKPTALQLETLHNSCVAHIKQKYIPEIVDSIVAKKGPIHTPEILNEILLECKKTEVALHRQTIMAETFAIMARDADQHHIPFMISLEEYGDVTDPKTIQNFNDACIAYLGKRFEPNVVNAALRKVTSSTIRTWTTPLNKKLFWGIYNHCVKISEANPKTPLHSVRSFLKNSIGLQQLLNATFPNNPGLASFLLKEGHSIIPFIAIVRQLEKDSPGMVGKFRSLELHNKLSESISHGDIHESELDLKEIIKFNQACLAYYKRENITNAVLKPYLNGERIFTEFDLKNIYS